VSRKHIRSKKYGNEGDGNQQPERKLLHCFPSPIGYLSILSGPKLEIKLKREPCHHILVLAGLWERPTACVRLIADVENLNKAHHSESIQLNY
jgi:hypothetical protein